MRSTSLTAHEKDQLTNEFGKDMAEDYIERTKAYHCCTYAKIRQWILEDKEKQRTRNKQKNQFHRFMEREASQEELDRLEKALLQH